MGGEKSGDFAFRHDVERRGEGVGFGCARGEDAHMFLVGCGKSAARIDEVGGVELCSGAPDGASGDSDGRRIVGEADFPSFRVFRHVEGEDGGSAGREQGALDAVFL